jgi:3,4-dihydroxy-2-butanone 4-phosphate synthase
MSQTLLTGLVLVAALACPVHMWLMNRRGKRVMCCPPRKQEQSIDLEALRERRQQIDAQLAEFEVRADPERSTTAKIAG